jgi:hypothetical protein
MSSVARITTAKARFFLDRAEEVGPSERDAFCNYLEASIVFARSVTFHLRKEFANRSGFAEWYATQQKLLGNNPLARFLLEKRNYVLKEGPIGTHRVVEVTMTTSIHLSGSATVKIVRGVPWYRRSLRVLWDDATYPLRVRLRSLQAKRAHSKARRQNELSIGKNAQSSGVTGTPFTLVMANGRMRRRPFLCAAYSTSSTLSF